MIKLRDYQASDLDNLLTLANNKNVARYLTDTFPHPYTKKDALWWLSTGCKTGLTKVIEYNDKYVGSVGAIPKTNEQRFTAAVGYWLGEEYWGKGIAHQALNLLVEEVFQNTEIIRLYAGVYSPNVTSMRVLEKSGFINEAILRKSVFKNGEFYDEHIYSKIKS